MYCEFVCIFSSDTMIKSGGAYAPFVKVCRAGPVCNNHLYYLHQTCLVSASGPTYGLKWLGCLYKIPGVKVFGAGALC